MAEWPSSKRSSSTKAPLSKPCASATSSRFRAAASSAETTPILARPSTCAWLAAMSCRKNSRSSSTSSPARKRMTLASMRVSDLFQSGSVMGNPGQLVEAQRKVDILHRLRRRTLEQVVQGSDDDDTPAVGRHRETANFGMVPMRDAADPWRIVDDAHQSLVGIGFLESRDDFFAFHAAIQIQVRGDGEAAKMRRDVRHEFHRQAELEAGFLQIGRASCRERG